jgi:hypothetical protein
MLCRYSELFTHTWGIKAVEANLAFTHFVRVWVMGLKYSIGGWYIAYMVYTELYIKCISVNRKGKRSLFVVILSLVQSWALDLLKQTRKSGQYSKFWRRQDLTATRKGSSWSYFSVHHHGCLSYTWCWLYPCWCICYQEHTAICNM